MDRKIKLIWDFRGPEARSFAEHHAIHLKEFAVKQGLALNDTTCLQQSDKHWMACLVVVESEMIEVRDALKPHRGVLA
jgi:hypothetical protein